MRSRTGTHCEQSTMMLGSESLRAEASLAAASWTEAASKLVPLVPPRRMTWTSGLPFVRTMAARPSESADEKSSRRSSAHV